MTQQTSTTTESTVDTEPQADSSTPYQPSYLAPDMTLPGLFLGLLAGGVVATIHPEQAKAALTLGIGMGWMVGFLATLTAESW